MARENIPVMHYPGKVWCWFAIVSNCSCTSCAAKGNISGFCMISCIHTKQLNRSVTDKMDNCMVSLYACNVTIEAEGGCLPE